MQNDLPNIPQNSGGVSAKQTRYLSETTEMLEFLGVADFPWGRRQTALGQVIDCGNCAAFLHAGYQFLKIKAMSQVLFMA